MLSLVYALVAKQLVDGVDIDTVWYHIHLPHLSPAEQWRCDFALPSAIAL